MLAGADALLATVNENDDDFISTKEVWDLTWCLMEYGIIDEKRRKEEYEAFQGVASPDGTVPKADALAYLQAEFDAGNIHVPTYLPH